MNPPLSTPSVSPNNKMALTSMISGIVGWALWVLLLCFNWTIGFVLSMATLGLLGICFTIVGYLPVIPWLAAVITGHVGISQLGRTGEGGRGMAIAGLIMGYLGIVLTICVLITLVLGYIGLIGLSTFDGFQLTPAP